MLKTILLTGGTGYLGSHLLPMLLAQGIECIVVVRPESHLMRINSFKNKISFCNHDTEALQKLFKNKKIDAVIHTATSYGRKNESIEQILAANLNFPLVILKLASEHGVKLFMNTDTILLPVTNYYSLTKAQFREWGQLFAHQGSLKFINIKMQHMYGPGDEETKFTSYVIRACLRNDAELLLTEGLQRRDFIYIEDVVSAYQYLLGLDYSKFLAFEDFELGSGVATRVRDYAVLVHELTNSKTELRFGAKPTPLYEKDYVADITKLKKIGWKPQFDLVKGLSATLMKEQKNCVT